MIPVCELSKCNGCQACLNTCPANAIVPIKDKMDRTAYYIDETTCIHCEKCQAVCQVNNPVSSFTPHFVLAAYSRDSEDKKLSASGGIASVASRTIIEKGGYVVGAACVDQKTQHIMIESTNDISLLRGSKYERSDVSFIFREIKEKLKDNKEVLFTGTPCQVAGLKLYLQSAYENLYTMDLICHGTAPHDYVLDHIRYKTAKSWSHYTFRGKDDFWFCIYSGKAIMYRRQSISDEYFVAYLNGLIFCHNCYNCPYAKKERVADITVGDFWGLDRDSLEKSYDGKISVVLVNTSQGERLWSFFKDKIIFEERTMEEAANEFQTNLNGPSLMHSERKVFERYYPKYGFEKAVRKTKLIKKIHFDYAKHCIISLMSEFKHKLIMA